MVCNSSVATMSYFRGHDMLQLDDHNDIWQPREDEDMGRKRQRNGDSDDFLAHPAIRVLHDQAILLQEIRGRMSAMEERVQHIETMLQRGPGPEPPANFNCPVCQVPVGTLKSLLAHAKKLRKQSSRRCLLQRTPRHMALLKAAAHINDDEFQLRRDQFCAQFEAVVSRGRTMTGDDGIVFVKSWIGCLGAESS